MVSEGSELEGIPSFISTLQKSAVDIVVDYSIDYLKVVRLLQH